MKNYEKIACAFLLFAMVFAIGQVRILSNKNATTGITIELEEPRVEKMSRDERKKARVEYFLRMYRDPATGMIPANVRNRELDFVKKISRKSYPSGSNLQAATWTEIGPNNVGGRTRGIAIDVENSNNIVTGGVNGGIWKSTDQGATWTQKSRSDLGITSIAQDVRTGQTSTWYAATGESSSSAGENGIYFGEGLWKSTDDAESWSCIQGCSPDLTANSQWDRIDRVAVNPSTGTVVVGSDGYGIYRSTNGGNSFTQVRSGNGSTDIAIHPRGRMLAAIAGTGANVGLAVSNDDGVTWSAQTMASNGDINRGVVAFANSDLSGNTAYSLFTTGNRANNADVMRLDLLNTGANTAVDRSANIPRLGTTNLGYFNSQDSWNLLIAVHPTDPNHVILGATNLYRSRNGFATAIPNDAAGIADGWIGGYNTDESVAGYNNHHPDCHLVVFDPNNVNAMWSAHDGGVSYLADIRPVIAAGSTVPWVDRNAGYNVTQFYNISMHPSANDNRLAGGLQDNGTPFFRTDSGVQINDLTTGDGGITELGAVFAIAESQNGAMNRYIYEQDGEPIFDGQIKPSAAPPNSFLFVHPYELNPSNEDVLVTPVGSSLWRNNDLANATETVGWSELTEVSSGSIEHIITAVGHTANTDQLFYASTDYIGRPRMFRLDNASTATDGEVEISDANWPIGAYPKDIATDPDDAQAIAVVFPNYNVPSVWLSRNGGQSWTNETGNLGGAQMGPSVRAIEIVTTAAGKELYIGTSTGVYSAPISNQVQSAATWVQESGMGIGATPVTGLDYRSSDDRLAVGTHGRGAWIGNVNPLPVELSNLSASLDGDEAVLNWSTYSETNNAGFEIQSNLEGEAWMEIGFIEGAGTTIENQSYEFRETLNHAGKYLFRIKQIDYDGAFEYSPVVEVYKDLPGHYLLSEAYPNPFNTSTSFSIQVRETQDLRVTMYDMSGREVKTLFNGEMGSMETKYLSIDGSDLTSGVYFYRAEGADFIDSRMVTLSK